MCDTVHIHNAGKELPLPLYSQRAIHVTIPVAHTADVHSLPPGCHQDAINDVFEVLVRRVKLLNYLQWWDVYIATDRLNLLLGLQ